MNVFICFGKQSLHLHIYNYLYVYEYLDLLAQFSGVNILLLVYICIRKYIIMTFSMLSYFADPNNSVTRINAGEISGNQHIDKAPISACAVYLPAYWSFSMSKKDI